MIDSIYSHEKLTNKNSLIFTFVFFIISLIGIYFHEIWMDESHHFLIGRDSESFIDLFNNTRYDGHPILWNYLIYLITQFSNNPFYMQLIHILISSCVVFIFLKKAPFKLWFKIAFLLSYFMLYEYTIISRNYNLGILFLFLSCSYYSKKNESFTLLCFFLALSCNTHSIFIIISCGFIVSLFLQQFNKLKFLFLKIYWKGYIVFILGLLIAFYQIIPASDATFFEMIEYSYYQSSKSFLSLFKAFFPIVDFTSTNYWNQFYVLNNVKYLAIILAILSWLIPFFLFNKNNAILLFVYITFGGFIVFEILTQRFGVRYNGILFLTIVMGLWMLHSEEKKTFWKINFSKHNTKIIIIFMLIQSFSGVLVYGLDIKKTFNHGENVAKYITAKKINLKEILTACESASINAYLNENLYNLYYQKEHGYYLWNKEYTYDKTQNELIELGFNSKSDKKKLYFILNDTLKIKSQANILKEKYFITLVKKFEGAVKNDYYLYLIEKN